MDGKRVLKECKALLENYQRELNYKDGFLRDRQVISSDFNKIGNDIKIAIKKYEKSSKK